MKSTPTVVSVINLKGGVGKTTVTALLARHAALQGLDVLVVDLDPQANLSQALMTGDYYIKFMEEKQPSVVELFNSFTPPSQSNPGPSALEPTDIIQQIAVGFKWAEELGKTKEILLDIIPSRFDFSDNLIQPLRVDERILAQFIAGHMQHKDLILIDCAPTESILTRASYHASRYVLIPVKTEFFSTIGFPLMKKSLEDFRSRNRGHKIDVCGVLVHSTRTSGSPPSVDGRRSLKDIRKKAGQYKWDIFRNTMYHSDGYPKLASNAFASHPGNASYEWPKIAKEILAKIGLNAPVTKK